jgi:hypothetical protein
MGMFAGFPFPGNPAAREHKEPSVNALGSVLRHIVLGCETLIWLYIRLKLSEKVYRRIDWMALLAHPSDFVSFEVMAEVSRMD